VRYFLSVIAEGSDLATPREMERIDAFNESLRKAGHWVFAAGLGSPSTATLIDNRGGAGRVTSGPFVETLEFVAGFWIIEAPNLDVALRLATEGSMACNRKVEVKSFLVMPE
jgi:hypothetical protein